MQGSKMLGWVLIVVGLAGAVGSYQSGYGGTLGIVAMLIVALLGIWLAFLRAKASEAPQMPPVQQ